MTSNPNPYEPGRVPDENRRVDPVEGPAVLHRGLGAIVGSLYGSCLVPFLAVMLIAIAIKSGLLDWFGIQGGFMELGIVFLPVCGLSGGTLSGLICGATRGQRLLVALAVALIAPVIWLIYGALISTDAKQTIFIAFTVLLSAIGSTLACHLLIAWIVRKRRAVVESLQAEGSASPGLAAAGFQTFITVCIVAALVTTFIAAGQIAGFLAGITAGGGIVGMLSGLHLLSAYPNRTRIGILTTIVCVFAVLIPIFLQIYQ
ncbi:hypothetical protein [Aporhodopirellula aestuarii]|uniref:Uncharacterized protein n=1 Tax=Aporhodopirellula aestuarii TaxID=2950107 RepID=A0ABT0U6K9_9BACT|nr:hypothetical protein [Aporhodopirellula aestuarii]MCM2372309.1 hypothetical protein [Aporhodopirellula aestuarii]